MVEGCAFCDLSAEAKADGFWDWSFQNPFYIIEGETGKFPEFTPVVPGHFMVVSGEHYEDASEDSGITGFACAKAAAEAESKGLDNYNLIVNCGADAGQTVFHLHVHIVPREAGDGVSMPWSP